MFKGIPGFHQARSCNRWWSTGSYQSKKIMLIPSIVCSSRLVSEGKLGDSALFFYQPALFEPFYNLL
jgi:hypothetical protein